jgi:hypothetical protein
VLSTISHLASQRPAAARKTTARAPSDLVDRVVPQIELLQIYQRAQPVADFLPQRAAEREYLFVCARAFVYLCG